jgi:hypothetical protein
MLCYILRKNISFLDMYEPSQHSDLREFEPRQGQGTLLLASVYRPALGSTQLFIR